MDGLTSFPNAPPAPILLGEGNGLSLSASFLSLGLENSFILERSDLSLCSFSTGGGGISMVDRLGLSLGYAALAAVAAAAIFPPSCPL